MSFFTMSQKSQNDFINSKLNLAAILQGLPSYPLGPEKIEDFPSGTICLPKLTAVNRIKQQKEFYRRKEITIPSQINADNGTYNTVGCAYESKVLLLRKLNIQDFIIILLCSLSSLSTLFLAFNWNLATFSPIFTLLCTFSHIQTP